MGEQFCRIGFSSGPSYCDAQEVLWCTGSIVMHRKYCDVQEVLWCTGSIVMHRKYCDVQEDGMVSSSKSVFWWMRSWGMDCLKAQHLLVGHLQTSRIHHSTSCASKSASFHCIGNSMRHTEAVFGATDSKQSWKQWIPNFVPSWTACGFQMSPQTHKISRHGVILK